MIVVVCVCFVVKGRNYKILFEILLCGVVGVMRLFFIMGVFRVYVGLWGWGFVFWGLVDGDVIFC